MRKSNEIDGTPDEVKVSCPVWREGKSGDYFKGLPITIADIPGGCGPDPEAGRWRHILVPAPPGDNAAVPVCR